MKKFLILLIFVFSLVLIGCNNNAIHAITDVDEFDEIIKDATRYDLRDNDECEKGHIPGFMCFGSYDNERTIKTLKLCDKKRNIVLIGPEDRIDYIFKELKKSGYKNLYYFVGGYETYSQNKIDFVPETGCGC